MPSAPEAWSSPHFGCPERITFSADGFAAGASIPIENSGCCEKGKRWFQPRLVHETVMTGGMTMTLRSPLLHHAYPTLSGYIDHMNKYSSLGAEMEIEKRSQGIQPH